MLIHLTGKCNVKDMPGFSWKTVWNKKRQMRLYYWERFQGRCFSLETLYGEKIMRRKIRMTVAFIVSVLMLSACEVQLAEPDETEVQPETEKEQMTAELTEEAAETEMSAEEEQDTDEKMPVTLIGVETGHYFDYQWDEASERIVASVRYPYMRISAEDIETYQKLEQSVAVLMDEREKNAMDKYSDAVQAAEESLAGDSEYMSEYEVSETVTVRRADTRVLSLMLDGYYYVGGVHGTPYTMGFTYDTVTGERLMLTDVVTDVEQLPDLVDEQLDIFWNRDYLYEDLDLRSFFDENLDSIQWVLDYNGITIYFNPYEIAPFASGILNVTISFAEHPELFKEQYRETPASYGVEFSLDNKFFYDVDGNGTLDALSVSASEGEYDNYVMQSIWLNGVWYEENIDVYQIEPTLIHMANGKNYLYVERQYPDDYWAYSVYDVSESFIEQIDIVYSRRHSISNWENDYYLRQVITDPQNFILDTCTYLLGTAYGYDSYHVGADGMPEQEHDWYLIENLTEFTMLRDLTLPVVDEEGIVTGKTEVKTGDMVIYYRTDGESWADLFLSDGSIARVTPVYEEWCWTVDGVSIEEVFDGIMFPVG